VDTVVVLGGGCVRVDGCGWMGAIFSTIFKKYQPQYSKNINGIIGSDFPKNPTRIGRFYFLTVMNKCRIIHVFQKSKLKSCDKSH